MGFLDKVKNLVGGNEDDYGDDNFGYGIDESNDYMDGEDEFYGTAQQPQVTPKMQPQPTATQPRAAQSSGMSINGNALELKVIRPERWEAVEQIADHLINRRTVVLNLESTNKETARRMIDFLLGVVYTIEGDIKKVAANTWVITPSNVDMSQDQQNRAANNAGSDNF